ncbi:MAG: O-antigen translocase [Gammaproteobacteria bacterium]|nr:O-antigen translocase [Gammaproteobacteria bacterium]
MRAIRSALLTTSAHLSKILVGFFLLKLIALYLGAEGLGVLGHFMSLVSIVTMLAGGGVVNGVIKFVAEYRFDQRKMLAFISAAAVYSVVICSVVLILGVCFSSNISVLLFDTDEFYWVVIFLAFAQLGFAFVNLVTGVCNGLGETKVFAKIQIVGSLLAFPLAWILVVNYGVAGAALAITSVFLMGVFPALFFCFRSSLSRRTRFSSVTSEDIKKLSVFTVMLLASAFTFPVVEIIVREFLIRNSGNSDAGLWQASIKLSGAYLGFFSVFLAYYFMPLISPIKDKGIIFQHVKKFMFLIMFIFSFGASIFYLWRDFFIVFLLSEDFSGLEDLIAFQLIGDFFKISSYVIGFVGVAKAASKLYIGAEIFQCALFLGMAMLFGSFFDSVNGVFFGYMVTYMIYFALSLCVFLFWKRN